jgi:hypothetical protein
MGTCWNAEVVKKEKEEEKRRKKGGEEQIRIARGKIEAPLRASSVSSTFSKFPVLMTKLFPVKGFPFKLSSRS